jgi:hypothetical protein
VALVRTDVSEEPGASFIRVTKIGELGTTQAATSNRRTLRFLRSVPLRSVTGMAFPFLYVDDVRTSRETYLCTSAVCYGDGFTFFYCKEIENVRYIGKEG